MKKIKLIQIILLLILATSLNATLKDYSSTLEVKKLINELVKNDGFDKEELTNLFKNVEVQDKALKYYTKPKKTESESKKPKKIYHGSWDRYEKKLLNDRRITLGADFMKRNKKVLYEAYKTYGVQPEYITAIIGIESYYGEYSGKYPVFDALTTLAFEKNRRNDFFEYELKEFLKLAKRNNQNPREIFGSYAGAIGLAQFMPSNFKKMGVDFNNDGKIDLHNEIDAIGSIAKYFHKSGWNRLTPVATRVDYKGTRFSKYKTGFKYKYSRSRLKGIKPKSENFFYADKVHLIKLDRYKFDELWYGTKNFYVITRYNRSNYYAMAVFQLAQKIKKAYRKNRV